MKEYLLFAVHRGTVSNRPAGILMQNHCLPLACSHTDWDGNTEDIPVAIDGFFALWQSVCDVEEFFEALGISSIEGGPGEKHPQGLYVYEVKYDPVDVGDAFDHLCDGVLRRPEIDEVTAFTQSGAAPWNGLVL